jgi:hypothetical protein
VGANKMDPVLRAADLGADATPDSSARQDWLATREVNEAVTSHFCAHSSGGLFMKWARRGLALRDGFP